MRGTPFRITQLAPKLNEETFSDIYEIRMKTKQKYYGTPNLFTLEKGLLKISPNGQRTTHGHIST